MKAGKLDRLIGLYHRVLTKNALGEDIPSYPTAYATVWASKTDSAATRHGAKVVVGDQFTLLQFTEFSIRYTSALLATDRVVDDAGLSYDIVQMGEMGRREGWNLLCRTVQP